MDLTMLTPGVTETDDQCGINCTGTNVVSNDSRGSTADILTDGVSVTNFEPNGGITNATYVPSPEAIGDAFNHPVFGTPDTSVDDPNFGTITYTSNGPRQVQVGIKVYF